MTEVLRLQIMFSSFWRVGYGIGQTGRVDVRAARDVDGLPVVPGRHLRGQLREAVRRAHEYGWCERSERELFGVRDVRDGDVESGGVLRVEDARMLIADRTGLLQVERFDRVVSGLFRTRQKTAIDPYRGVAKTHSLRKEEVVVPLQLESQVSLVDGPAPPEWRDALISCLPLVRYMGAGRSRGLGRCKVMELESAHG